MEHLVIPTRDYLFAPSIADITRAVNFIHSECDVVLSFYPLHSLFAYHTFSLCNRECFAR